MKPIRRRVAVPAAIALATVSACGSAGSNASAAPTPGASSPAGTRTPAARTAAPTARQASPAIITLPPGTATPEPPPTPTRTAVPEEAVWIPGTHTAMVPPAGWEAASDFGGFADPPSGSSIVVVELPTDAAAMVAGMSDAQLATRGVEVSAREEVVLNGMDALLLEGRQGLPGGGGTFGKVLLVTGTTTLTLLVTGNYPHGDEPLRRAVLGSVRTAVLDPSRPTDARDALAFTVTPATPLRFAGAIGNGALYNTSGGLVPSAAGEPVLIIAPSLGPVPISDAEAFARQRLAATPQLTAPQVEREAPVTIAEMDGIELTGTGTWSGGTATRVAFYQVLLVDPAGGYVLMSGIAPEDEATTAIQAFRATAETYRPRS